MTGEPFLAWPGRAHLAHAAGRGVGIAVLFAIVFGGADFLAGLRSDHWGLYLAWELAIPLWPAAVLVYDSLYLLFALAPFVLRTKAAIDDLASTLAVAIVGGGLCFLLLPCRLGFDAPLVTGPLAGIFRLTDALNLDSNLVPSLHVALATACVSAFRRTAPPLLRRLLIAWAAGIALSTLVTHQHHLLDVATGVALALASERALLWWRRASSARAVQAA